ncbi:hypothetical protein BGX23_009172 [Mortierella sp. AD031]|nr:hypothetical protein BGX23_009172 [Mortierella sp. AD031]KAG0216675.1 hypothetical protein BGX33_012344 [Mortierella sp. NVP41]
MCANEECPQPKAKTFLCSRCRNTKFCSKDCQAACLSWHKKACIDPNKTVFNLMKTVYADDFNVMSEALRNNYGFEKCKNFEELQILLGLYQGIIKALQCDINELDKAFNDNKLPEFIVSTYFY